MVYAEIGNSEPVVHARQLIGITRRVERGALAGAMVVKSLGGMSKNMDTAMNATRSTRSGARWLGACVGLAAASYAANVAVTWYRYGQVALPAHPEDGDSILDRFIPTYEVVERHHVRVATR